MREQLCTPVAMCNADVLKRLVVSSLQEHPRDPMRDRQELATISCTFEEVEFFGRHPDVFQALGAVLVVTPLGLIHKEFV